MTLATRNFTTGPSVLPDVGVLSYNGCIFSPLYETNISGKCINDDAQRTTKFMEYVITADGYVTLPDGQSSTSPTMANLRSLLTAQGGVLFYQGRGNDIIVNIGNNPKDAAWGPIPEILEFQPLGAGRSAKIKWTVKVHIVEPLPGILGLIGGGPGGGVNAPIQFFKGGQVIPGPAKAFQAKQAPAGVANAKPPRMLQFNYESTVSYGEDGFSTLSNKGILEIPLTRDPNQSTRTFTNTADDLRGEIERRVMSGIPLERFHITRRNFSLSRDKRTLTWDFVAEERPYMDMPVGCTIARGSYTVKPATAGMGLATWMCTLRCTYTVRAGFPRRTAWSAFLAILRLRMRQSEIGKLEVDEPKPKRKVKVSDLVAPLFTAGIDVGNKIVDYLNKFNKSQEPPVKKDDRRAWLMDFSIDEGIYQDSKTITFSATWRLNAHFHQILINSGIWTKVEDNNRTLWATSMKDIQGVQSWIPDKAATDIIVDFGGG